MVELETCPCQSCTHNSNCRKKCAEQKKWFLESWQMLRQKLLGVDGNG